MTLPPLHHREGGGLQHDESIEVRERIINAVHRHAPTAAVAFRKVPGYGIKAASRVLSRDFVETDGRFLKSKGEVNDRR